MAKESTGRRYAYRITKPGAQHRSKRNGVWKTFVTDDTLDLTLEQFASGRYDHLGLRPLVGGKVIVPDLVSEAPEAEEKKAPVVEGEDNGDDDENEGLDKALVNRLITAVDAARGKAEVSEARDLVIKADLFEADTVPTAKGELLEALKSLLEE